MTRKRHFHLTEEILRENPNICNYKAPSFDARQDMLVHEVPKLWPRSSIEGNQRMGPIHLKHNTPYILHYFWQSGMDMAGADYQLTKLLGLNPFVNRHMIYLQRLLCRWDCPSTRQGSCGEQCRCTCSCCVLRYDYYVFSWSI